MVVLFAGDGLQHAGWVLAHSSASGRHHVLYDDGEVRAAKPSCNAWTWQRLDLSFLKEGGCEWSVVG